MAKRKMKKATWGDAVREVKASKEKAIALETKTPKAPGPKTLRGPKRAKVKVKKDKMAWVGKPGPRPLKQILVKIDAAELKLINSAIKKSNASKASWLKDVLIKAAQEAHGGEFSGKHKTLAPVAEEEEIPDATEHADEVDEARQAQTLAVPVPVPIPGPALSMPAPMPAVQAWQLGRVPPPVWQQSAPMTVPAPAPAEVDEQANGEQPPVQ